MNAEQRYPDLCNLSRVGENLRRLNRVQLDLLHILEDLQLSPVKLAIVAAKLRDVRRERRYWKELANVVGCVDGGAGAVAKAVDGIDERQRVNKGLALESYNRLIAPAVREVRERRERKRGRILSLDSHKQKVG